MVIDLVSFDVFVFIFVSERAPVVTLLHRRTEHSSALLEAKDAILTAMLRVNDPEGTLGTAWYNRLQRHVRNDSASATTRSRLEHGTA